MSQATKPLIDEQVAKQRKKLDEKSMEEMVKKANELGVSVKDLYKNDSRTEKKPVLFMPYK
jgi:hypothetical protein